MFEVNPAAVAEPKAAQAVPVTKTFRTFVTDQLLLLPPSLDEWLPERHLARFVAELVDEVLDLVPVLASYTEKRRNHPEVHLRAAGTNPCLCSSPLASAQSSHGSKRC